MTTAKTKMETAMTELEKRVSAKKGVKRLRRVELRLRDEAGNTFSCETDTLLIFGNFNAKNFVMKAPANKVVTWDPATGVTPEDTAKSAKKKSPVKKRV